MGQILKGSSEGWREPLKGVDWHTVQHHTGLLEGGRTQKGERDEREGGGKGAPKAYIG